MSRDRSEYAAPAREGVADISVYGVGVTLVDRGRHVMASERGARAARDVDRVKQILERYDIDYTGLQPNGFNLARVRAFMWPDVDSFLVWVTADESVAGGH